MFEGCHVVLTGSFSFGTRKDVTNKLEEFGAIIHASPSRKTDVVVIGTEGSPHYTHKHHGGKLGKALNLRASSSAPRIYTEMQLAPILR